jgi:hypothetical protein
MSWVDLRVMAEDAPRAVAALLDADIARQVVLDLHPPAAGPEVEISLEAPVLGETSVLEPLRDAAVTVLAHRQRTWSR